MTKNKIVPTIVLTVICLVSALLLGVINMVTKDVILKAELKAATEAMQEVLPGATSFEEVNIEGKNLPKEIVKANKADNGGYVFQIQVTGYKPGIVIMVGVTSDGAITKITKIKTIKTSETWGLEKKLDGEYNDGDIGSINKKIEDVAIELTSKATSLSSKAYKTALKAALEAYGILSTEGGQSNG